MGNMSGKKTFGTNAAEKVGRHICNPEVMEETFHEMGVLS